MLSVNVLGFLQVWHENGRASFEARYKNLDYDQHETKSTKDRQFYIALDTANGGRFLVRRYTK